MTGRLTRRELIFNTIPRVLAAGYGMFGAASVLAEPIQRHKMRLNEYANHLLLQHWERFLRVKERHFSEFCKEHGLENNEEVAHVFVASLLFHELIRKNGILKNEYMAIDERPTRLMKVDGRALTGDELMLRGPGIMLRDIFSGKPRYQVDGRSIHCFGDCDEYEMAYVTILKAVGVQARVVMSEASHVKTQVEINGKHFLVDNTRNSFGKPVRCKGKCRDYRTGELGYMEPQKARRYVSRINRLAEAGTNVRIYPKGAERVDGRIEKAIRKMEIATGISAYQEGTGQPPSSQEAHTIEEGKAGSR